MNIAGRISDEWRTLDRDSKSKWEDMAREDKERYQREKAAYSGPWKVRTNLRKPKDPNSPKKPVPAYFAFSNERRQEVKNQNPNATNGEISRLLSKMWNEAPEEIRRKYLDQEAKERAVYTEKMKEWRAKRKELEKQEAKESARSDTLGSVGGAASISSYDSKPHGASFEFSAPRNSSNFLENLSNSSSAAIISNTEPSNPVASSYDAIRMFRESASPLQNVSQSAFIPQNRPLPAADVESGLLSQLLGRVQPNVPASTPSSVPQDGEFTNRLLLAALQQQVSPPSQARLPILGGSQLSAMNPALLQRAIGESAAAGTANAGLASMLNRSGQQQHSGQNLSLNTGQTGANSNNMELLLISRLLQGQQTPASIQTSLSALNTTAGGEPSQQGAMLQSFLRYLASGGEGGPYGKPTGP